MMGMFSESLRRRFGDEFLAIARGGGEENFLLALGELGGSPYRSLLFWLLAKNNSRDLHQERIYAFEFRTQEYVFLWYLGTIFYVLRANPVSPTTRSLFADASHRFRAGYKLQCCRKPLPLPATLLATSQVPINSTASDSAHGHCWHKQPCVGVSQ